MPGRFTTVRSLLRRITSDLPETPELVRAGRRLKHEGEGTGSLFLWPTQAVMRRLAGRKKVDRAIYEKFHRPLTNIDERLGRRMEKEFGTRKLFRQVDVLPTKRKIDGQPALIEHERHSATAPISKAVEIASPLAAILYATSLMDKKHEKTASGKDALLEKAAAALEWADKRSTAEKLAFEMVEQGRIPPFQDYDQFRQRVDSLMEKDLDVVKEALEIDPVTADFGKLAEDNTGSFGASAVENFYHALAE